MRIGATERGASPAHSLLRAYPHKWRRNAVFGYGLRASANTGGASAGTAWDQFATIGKVKSGDAERRRLRGRVA